MHKKKSFVFAALLCMYLLSLLRPAVCWCKDGICISCLTFKQVYGQHPLHVCYVKRFPGVQVCWSTWFCYQGQIEIGSALVTENHNLQSETINSSQISTVYTCMRSPGYMHLLLYKLLWVYMGIGIVDYMEIDIDHLKPCRIIPSSLLWRRWLLQSLEHLFHRKPVRGA